MRRDREDNRDTSVSFLDVIACAFGAVTLLVLILPIGDFGNDIDTPRAADYGRSLWALASLEKEVAAIEMEVAENDEMAAVLNADLAGATDKTRYLQSLIDRTRNTSKQLRDRSAAITAGRRIMERAPAPAEKNSPIDTELAGIPVDSQYIAFVVDTSTSMKVIWEPVMKEITNVLSIYPKVRGFQILNDQGRYLFGNRKKRWIPDSPSNRRQALREMRDWQAFSASNPAPGILTAVNDLYDRNRKMAIFVFGDDYASNDFDGFLQRVDKATASRSIGRGSFRIHAIGFSNEGLATRPLNFGVLMRELTRRHRGAFLALPERNTPLRVAIVRDRSSLGVD